MPRRAVVRIASSIPVLILCALAGCAPARSSRPAQVPGAANDGPVRGPLTLHAERTNFDETGTYAEAVAFCRQLAAMSPYARYTTFGVTGEGRPLPLLIVSKAGMFTSQRRAEEAKSESRKSESGERSSGRALVLIQNCIHAGECEGKDATLMLVRDMLLGGQHTDVLERVDLLIMPIFNADGHERRGLYHRANQNGPREQGWRTNAVNLNLNRDYVKADSVEMQAWLKLWTAWQPDVLIDDHTTDGHDHQYDFFYAGTDGEDAAEPVRAWVRDVLYPRVLSQMEADGHLCLPYSFPRDAQDPNQGIQAIPPMGPRLSTGYAAACNRVGLLVETHSWRPYGQRVHATYDFLAHTLNTVAEHAGALQAAIRAADKLCAETRGGERDGKLPLDFEPVSGGRRRRGPGSRAATSPAATSQGATTAPISEPGGAADERASAPTSSEIASGKAPGGHAIVYRGVVQRVFHSEISDSDVIEYTKTPLDTPTELFDEFRVAKSVAPPLAYLIPPQWTDVIRRLELHGVQCERLATPVEVEVESYRFEDIKLADSSYEGRQQAQYKTIPFRGKRKYAAGSVLVRLDQPRAKLALHLLEPEAGDSCIAWGMLDGIFEQKEYAEAYVLEPLARRMRAADPALAVEFEAKLKSDPEFAKNPGRRLDFFYQRSNYRDVRRNVYPIGRILDAAELERLTTAAKPGATAPSR